MKSANSQTITLIDGRKLGYAEYGNLKGKPVLLFHGWPGSRLGGSVFNELAMKLNIRLISLDRPGYGLSDFKQNRKLLDYADDVIEFANKLQIKNFAVLGVSGGGPYALVCAYKIPKRITKVGIASGMVPLKEEAIKHNSKWWKFLLKNYRYTFFSTFLTRLHYIESNYFPSLFVKFYRVKYDKNILVDNIIKNISVSKKEAFRSGLRGAVHDLLIYSADWGFNIANIKKEVQLWHGELDTIVPITAGKYFAASIPKAKLITYPNEAHSIFISHTEEILKKLI